MEWRRARDAGVIEGLTAKTRCPKARAQHKEIERLRLRRSGSKTNSPRTSRLWRSREAKRNSWRGLSRTDDPRQAAWFADRFRNCRPATFVFKVTVDPHRVLAIIGGRNENEVVLNPYCLRGKATPSVVDGPPRFEKPQT